MENKRLLCVDSDGVLAKWNPNVSEADTRVPGYFRTCVPDEKLIRVLKRVDEFANVCILTSAYKTGTARLDKCWWFINVAKVDFPIIFCDYGTSKDKRVRNENAILLDDYSKNLHEWTSSGRKGIKYRNGINGTRGTWNGASLSWEMSENEMFERLMEELR